MAVFLLHSGIGDVNLNCGFCDTTRVFVFRDREGREERGIVAQWRLLLGC